MFSPSNSPMPNLQSTANRPDLTATMVLPKCPGSGRKTKPEQQKNCFCPDESRVNVAGEEWQILPYRPAKSGSHQGAAEINTIVSMTHVLSEMCLPVSRPEEKRHVVHAIRG